jgi:hypothetical protein
LNDFKLAEHPTLSPADLSLINNRLEKLKTWHQRAELVLPLMGKLIG